ncbi:hypothetical protein TNCT_177831 [Trichonephila clavata]|uniref:Uncharacterized protein n=1 Tax=Trichonephila clavata TaxID=2740835 RepID=A0A8X6J0U8_TRICU|nr:hypothetical protein TNCT_177831 [Trichonephila clavata]
MGGGSDCSERDFFPRPPDVGETVARLSFLRCLGLRAEAAVGTCLGLGAEAAVGTCLGLVTEAASSSLSCSSLVNRKGIDFKPKTNGYPRLDLNFPDYDDEEDDFGTVRDSLASPLVSKTSTETPLTSFEKPDLSSDNRSLIPWFRG